MGYLDNWPENEKIVRAPVRANMVFHSPSSISIVSASSQVFTPEQWKVISSIIGNAPISNNCLTGKFDPLS